ncbi:MAG TPA: hypothetical protein PLM14_07510 [Candidatus Hydrogenedentes bacterium]|nr:hypothetical protein [Candidatus Hydrogenedentota bacterium]HQE82835.1 hypothetical protein [Candidatus Hydrogenedentota bacterium]HQH52878.1 hypothetical protein [Candidatus Hydrogenedentota bacterium]HQM47558.1 hypothetical protein [Candidatus Hydrogenedentota bacterium]
MKTSCIVAVLLALALASPCISAQNSEDPKPAPPRITKLGTIDCDMVETTPVVFHGRLYRFEYVRDSYYKPNTTGRAYFRFMDVAGGKPTSPFAWDHHLGSAFVNDGTMYVFGVDKWGGECVQVYWSEDLETWDTQPGIQLSGWELFNNSVCKADNRYVMALEIGAPPQEAGQPFTMRFLESDNLRDWRLTPSECVYTKERYSACPSLAYLDGFFYMFYLESYPGYYAEALVRSKDLIHWEPSPFNPVLKHSDDDRKVANQALSEDQRERIRTATNINNSDFDCCEFEGKTVILYSWGNQQGIEHLAEAVYDGTKAKFLRAFFPAKPSGR